MSNVPVDILLGEDDPNDVELTLHALRKYHLANSIHVVRALRDLGYRVLEAAKGVAFLQKPFTPAQLAHKVREVLDK